MNKEKEKKLIDADELDDNDIIVVKDIKIIDDGQHEGHITNMVRELRQDFDYVDIYIELEPDSIIKTGFPCNVSKLSTFGKFLKDAGIETVVNQKLSLKDIKIQLIGKNITFTTYTEESGFARIINKTIKFID